MYFYLILGVKIPNPIVDYELPHNLNTNQGLYEYLAMYLCTVLVS